MEITQALINRLIEMGFSKWRIMKSLTPEPSYRTVDAWSKGEWNAKKEYLNQLQNLYNEKCRALQIGLYAQVKSSR
jgi:hypothetical protein